MEWEDEGIVLTARRHGERGLVVSALTFEHGRHSGHVLAGNTTKSRPLYQTGNRLTLSWRARLADQLGNWSAESIRPYAASVMEDPLGLAGLTSACSVVEGGLAEREPHPRLYAALVYLLDRMAGDEPWIADYVRFELVLLAELGFGLNLESCAVTGTTGDLAYVSPKTGRAVSEAGAGDYASRLLPLPAFLIAGGDADGAAAAAGLRLAGSFLTRHIFAPADRPLPAARDRFAGLLGRAGDSDAS